MERVLVTGATGFIGRALVKRLIAQGAQVTALVREKPGQLRHTEVLPEVEIIEGDLRYAAGLKRAVAAAAPTWVAHLAAVGVTDPFLPIHEALRGNVEGTINLLKAVAGRCPVLVARTPGEIEALNPYAASKAAAWQFCRMFQRTEGWAVIGVMPFQTYGPGQPSRSVLGAALNAAQQGDDFPMTSGEQARDWIYLDEVIDGILLTAQADMNRLAGETIELGTGVATPVRAVVERVFQLVGKGQPRVGVLAQRPNEPASQIAEVDRSERLIGWRAKVGLEAGLQRWLTTAAPQTN